MTGDTFMHCLELARGSWGVHEPPENGVTVWRNKTGDIHGLACMCCKGAAAGKFWSRLPMGHTDPPQLKIAGSS